MTDVEEHVAHIIVRALDVKRDMIKPSSRFQEDLDADSLELVELVMSVEEELDIEIPDEKIESIRTVGDLLTFIKLKQHAFFSLGKPLAKAPPMIYEARAMENIAEHVRQSIASHLKVGVSDLADEARFVEDLNATSLDIVEMIMTLEDDFEVEISDTNADQMHTVGDVVAFMSANRKS